MNAPTSDTRPASPSSGSPLDPFDIIGSSLAVQQAWLRQPERLAAILQGLALDTHRVHDRFARTSLGIPSEPAIPAVIRDQRFQDPAWIDHPGFAYLKEIYLLYGRWLEDAIYATEGIDPARRRRAAFWIRQWLDAIAPSNFFWTNPEALRRGIASHGCSMLWGLQNWLRDAAAGEVRMVEPDAFQVGRDLATTPGQVVLRNELLELIQYAPTTDQVHAMPVVLVAPWINKYYIMDLSPSNSLVRYLVGQGFTVFVTSWKNPGPEARATTLDDYLLQGRAAGAGSGPRHLRRSPGSRHAATAWAAPRWRCCWPGSTPIPPTAPPTRSPTGPPSPPWWISAIPAKSACS